MRLGGSEVTQYEVVMQVGEKKEAIGFARSGKRGMINLVQNCKKAQSLMSHISDDEPLTIKGAAKKTVIKTGNVSIFFSGKTEKMVLSGQ